MAHLPADVIQCIQSLLTAKEAARTTLLSKSWYGAWATTPNLSFDEYELRERLPQLAKKTLQRYEHLNLNIQSFSLQMYGEHSLARELISKAMELGATDLKILVEDNNTVSFVLPDKVVESQTLTRLSVFGCTVELGRRKKKEVIPCFTLKSLHLSYVTVNGDFFNDLSWRFPLIEEFTLKKPKSLPGTQLALDVGAMMKLHKLEYLRMEGLDIKDSFSKHDLWPQLRYLKELVVQNFQFSKYWNDIRICSQSLERIVILLHWHGNVNAEFDVPNIRYLKLGCAGFPRLKFETTMMSREWVSDIEISWWDDCNFFYKLKQFVKVVSCVSRVSLHIAMMRGYNWAEGYVGDDGLGVAALENLTLENIGVTSAFVDDLLRCCRPNFIYLPRWEVNVEALQQLGRLPWKTNTFTSLNPWDFLFAIREGKTLSDTQYVRFQLR
ncbi:uncharacterized protein LOC130993037 [Salvia miltiorrhiza]|uniref:uncharacterized protein LOC130993037 n=1 Tax=Salvia miltiorrhiza TaxID=226208 RepID=UPI0025AD16D9|nr:uncharacterized protein LOC130993037 [Salvia miltiorrhiza]